MLAIPGFKGEVREDRAARAAASRDTSLFEVVPRAVAFPKDSEDIKALVRFAQANRDLGISLTARAAGTDMSGGPLNESIIVDITRHMGAIRDIGYGTVTVEPGAYYRDVERALAKRNFLIPSYPASKSLCAVGGMVANNAGGEKTLKYGKTERYVKRLTVVLSDGNEYVFQPLNIHALKKKLRLPGFEGDVYRGMYSLLNEHRETIHRARPRAPKNSAGYALWDIWDGKTFDLTKLFVGSQGTLGIITEIIFRTVRPAPHARMAVIFINNMSDLARVVPAIAALGPESFESYDRHTFALGARYFLFTFFWQFIPEAWMLIKNGGTPALVLLAEFTGQSDREAAAGAERAHAAMRAMGIRSRVAQSERESQKYWAIRRESFALLRTKVKGKQTAPFIDDVSVDPAVMPQFLTELNALLDPYKNDMTYTIAGHVGDGNFHVIPLMDLRNPRAKTVVQELAEQVYALVARYHGSITGEHNDGIIRTPYLATMFGEDACALFAGVKRLFDPHAIFNPGKKVGGTKEYAFAHFRRS